MTEPVLNDVGLPLPGLNNEKQLATWVHRALGDLLTDTGTGSFVTRTEIANRIHQIRSISGTLADQPTDLSAHVGCDLEATIVVYETWDAHASPVDYGTLLMDSNKKVGTDDTGKVTRVWCRDHERWLEDGDEKHLRMEWS